MVGLSASATLAAWPEIRDQFAAIARLRWCIFTNSMRTLRGRLEGVSWVLMGCLFALVGLGGMIGFGAAAYSFVASGKTEWLATFFWVTFLYWQIFPVMATAFSESFDSTNFLRFPLRYRSYFFIRMAYGALDPATLVSSLWLLGIFAGISAASPAMLPWAAVVLAAFAAFNLLLNRAVFAWIERWLGRRKSREILGIVFFLLIISFQLIGPLFARLRPNAHHSLLSYGAYVIPVERLLPPGLAGAALAQATHAHFALAFGAFALLCAYAVACLWILDVRLRAQFHGEQLSETVAPAAARGTKTSVRAGWDLPGLSHQVSAVFEKELRYLARSPVLFTMIMPIVILFIFSLGNTAMKAGRAAHPSAHYHPAPALGQYAFPIGVAYALMTLTNLCYNCLGADGGGVQMYYVAPIRFRDVLLGKNLAHAAIIAVETAAIWVAVRFMFGVTPLGLLLATFSALLFAAIVNFAVGDCVSLLAPKKMDWSMFGRQRAAGTAALTGIVVQMAVIGLISVTFLLAHYYGRWWLAVILNLVFAGAALAGYALTLGRIDALARNRREAIISELLRAT
jgi:ABC-2 type transport system permease protein